MRSAVLGKQAKEASEKLAKQRADLKSKGISDRDLPPISNSPPTIHLNVVTYVELATGLVVRAETEAIAGTDRPMRTVSVLQRLALP